MVMTSKLKLVLFDMIYQKWTIHNVGIFFLRPKFARKKFGIKGDFIVLAQMEGKINKNN